MQGLALSMPLFNLFDQTNNHKIQMAAWRSPLAGLDSAYTLTLTLTLILTLPGLDSAFAGPYVPTGYVDDVGQIVRKWLGGQGPSPSEQVSPTSMPLLDE